MSGRAKKFLILIPLAAILVISAQQALTFWWRRGYSVGERSGVIRKISIKGSPVCKYASGEMMLQGTLPGVGAETWEFSVDDKDDKHPLMVQLREAERAGTRVTLKYRQDLPSWWTCNPIQYHVTAVEK